MRTKKPIPGWLQWLAILAVVVICQSSVAELNCVSSRSMMPALVAGDRVWVNKLAYGWCLPFTSWRLLEWGSPQRGDIVIFFSPGDNKRCIKRVTGVPGDRVEANGESLIVPEGHYFLTGDNAAQSWDSRAYGCVDRARIVGRASAIVLSLNRADHYWPRWDRICRRLG
jgi:signal peptidase I